MQADQVWTLCGGVSERFGELASVKFKDQVSLLFLPPAALTAALTAAPTAALAARTFPHALLCVRARARVCVCVCMRVRVRVCGWAQP
jgi:hypothetical protein